MLLRLLDGRYQSTHLPTQVVVQTPSYNLNTPLNEQSSKRYLCQVERLGSVKHASLQSTTTQANHIIPHKISTNNLPHNSTQQHQSQVTQSFTDNTNLSEPTIANTPRPTPQDQPINQIKKQEFKMATRYRYIPERTILSSSPYSQSPAPSLPSSPPVRKSGAIAQYAQLLHSTTTSSQQPSTSPTSSTALYHSTLLQKLVLSHWRDLIQRRKQLAWKVLIAMRLRVLMRKEVDEVNRRREVEIATRPRTWEEEAGELCLVS